MFSHVWEPHETLQFVTYWIWTSSDMFQHVQTCLRITWMVTICNILNLNKFKHVSTCSDIFENHMNRNNSDLENLKNLDNWVLWTFCELTCAFLNRSILSSLVILKFRVSAGLAMPISRYLWRGSLNFKIKNYRLLFTKKIWFKNVKTRLEILVHL
jgi:hypothetical protein